MLWTYTITNTQKRQVYRRYSIINYLAQKRKRSLYGVIRFKLLNFMLTKYYYHWYDCSVLLKCYSTAYFNFNSFSYLLCLFGITNLTSNEMGARGHLFDFIWEVLEQTNLDETWKFNSIKVCGVYNDNWWSLSSTEKYKNEILKARSWAHSVIKFFFTSQSVDLR